MEKVKSREATTPQQLLMALMDVRVSLSSLLDEERRRLRMIPRHDPSAAPAILAGSAGANPRAAIAELPRPTITVRAEPVIEREPHFRVPPAPVPEPKPRSATGLMSSVDTGPRRHDEPEANRPENPRKRLDELAKLLDKRVRQSSETGLKGSGTKEVER